jgi:hypothetical protein
MKKEEHQEPPSRRREEDELWQMDFTKNKAWLMEMAILKFPGGYCWGYTKWVYQRRSPKPASQGGPSDGMADCLSGGPVAAEIMAVLDAGAHGGSEDRPMAGCLVVHA